MQNPPTILFLKIAERLPVATVPCDFAAGIPVASEMSFVFLPSLRSPRIVCLGQLEILWDDEVSLIHNAQDYH